MVGRRWQLLARRQGSPFSELWRARVRQAAPEIAQENAQGGLEIEEGTWPLLMQSDGRCETGSMNSPFLISLSKWPTTI